MIGEAKVTSLAGTDASRKFDQIVPKETYLARLSEIDRTNLQRFIESFEAALKRELREGALIASGSTVTGKRRPKLTPTEQDIDLLIIFQKLPNEPESDGQTEAQLKVFEVFKGFLHRIILGTAFRIDEGSIVEPFSSPGGYLRHSRAIAIRSDEGGMPIELNLSNRPFEGVRRDGHLYTKATYCIVSNQMGLGG